MPQFIRLTDASGRNCLVNAGHIECIVDQPESDCVSIYFASDTTIGVDFKGNVDEIGVMLGVA